jgi:hypothetical protein
MADLSTYILMIKVVLAELNPIAKALDKNQGWSTFMNQLVELLNELERAEDQDRLLFWVDEIMDLGMSSSAESIFRNILDQSQAAELSTDRMRSIQLDEQSLPVQVESDAGAAALYEAVGNLSQALDIAARRVINAWVANLAKEELLQVKQIYNLMFDVNLPRAAHELSPTSTRPSTRPSTKSRSWWRSRRTTVRSTAMINSC